MPEFVVTFGVATHADLDVDADAKRRRDALFKAAFTLGPAWHGNQSAIFVRTELRIDEIMSRLAPFIGASDVLVVAELGAPNSVRFAGWVCDGEGFSDLFPDAKPFE